jgi:hypothetical protein
MFWRNILVGILLYSVGDPVFAQTTKSQPVQVQESFFETIFPPLSDDDAKTYRDGFLFGCNPKANENADFDCHSADIIVAIKLIAETARMNGFLRACGHRVWIPYFQKTSLRVEPVFHKIGNPDGSPAIAMHGRIQGTTAGLVMRGNLCSYIPENVDRSEFLAIEADKFFTSRLQVIENRLSVPRIYSDEELALIEGYERERKLGNVAETIQPR